MTRINLLKLVPILSKRRAISANKNLFVKSASSKFSKREKL